MMPDKRVNIYLASSSWTSFDKFESWVLVAPVFSLPSLLPPDSSSSSTSLWYSSRRKSSSSLVLLLDWLIQRRCHEVKSSSFSTVTLSLPVYHPIVITFLIFFDTDTVLPLTSLKFEEADLSYNRTWSIRRCRSCLFSCCRACCSCCLLSIWKAFTQSGSSSSTKQERIVRT
jgi:hypothetical protein